MDTRVWAVRGYHYATSALNYERLTGFELAISALATPRSGQLSYNRMKPARRIELRLHPYQGCVLPLPLSRHGLGKRDSDVRLIASKATGLPVTPFPSEPPPGAEPGTFRLTLGG